MKKQMLLGIIMLAALLVAGCVNSQKTTEKDDGKQSKEENQINEEQKIIPQSVTSPVSKSFELFVNKAAGYSIERPQGWYWQHLIREEIGQALPLVDDLFITDSRPLQGLAADPLGQIVLEISRGDMGDLSDLDRRLQGLEKKSVMVAGVEADRYEGLEAGLNQKVIEYRFTKDNKTYRLTYQKTNNTSSDEQIFEHVAQTMKFE